MYQSSCKQTETVRSSADSRKLAMTSHVGGGELHTRAAATGKTWSNGLESKDVSNRCAVEADRSRHVEFASATRRMTATPDRQRYAYTAVDCYWPSRAAAAIEIYDATASRGFFARAADEILDLSPTTV